MSADLILALRGDNEGDWLLREDGRTTEHGRLPADLEHLRNLSRQTPVTVLVPGEDVVQFSVSLPVAGAAATAALPYQIEDRLSCDLDAVHFTHERIRANEPCRVWVVERERMADWHRFLQDSGLRVRAVMPDYALLKPGVLLSMPEHMIANLPSAAATLETALAEDWLALQSQDDTELTRLTCDDSARSKLEKLASHRRSEGINLCQGAFALHDPFKDALALMRWPAIAALLVLGLHWLWLALGAMQFGAQADQYDQAAEDLYRKTFPEARRVVNARSQMKSQLNAFEGQQTDGGLLTLLAPVAQAFSGQSDIQISQLLYQADGGSLRLTVDAANYGAIDSFSNALQGQGIAVSRGTFRQNGERVAGQLSLNREGGS
ncbi:general secretion pathway protein L [Litorivivens lipolytica]|uniref:Type II secretion system protein L n=1 Tax=Litorivivens lipolytica TaxID=1524264 RepID=A0A7W4W6Z9_9GAMM|nr:type II secretion system protein GspL [Litorivivens lipolytica]MBB3048074.1 general secretion pathway protein L [Litorivivens lipolytica]